MLPPQALHGDRHQAQRRVLGKLSICLSQQGDHIFDPNWTSQAWQSATSRTVTSTHAWCAQRD
jgi:hypothetical protein